MGRSKANVDSMSSHGVPRERSTEPSSTMATAIRGTIRRDM